LENPNLLEHESFTDLLRAVFHMTEEFDKRAAMELNEPSDADRSHIINDIKRSYVLLVHE
jgi:hypothetical protein